ncbi:calmodulin calcium-dependent NAD kinase-like [Cornus florida]|uniref:calmodulin calcium-dependent NAD kinase-like n=1 Tax=Cornus florida TaxID=4283 RepID=UPI00289F5123|nr:calmodulin calcium-dependent NAD kinase-like [Cornus florida]
MQKDGYGKVNILAHILAATSIGFISAGAAIHFYRKKSKFSKENYIIPRFESTGSSHGGKHEAFSHYVVRQIGFKDASECPQLCKLANEYLRKTKDCEEKMYEYFAKEKNAESLYVKLVEEFETCILSYFAFSWSKASSMITQVLRVDYEKKRFIDIVMQATRKRRFEKVTKDLKVTRMFTTLVEEMKAIGYAKPKDESECTAVMTPVDHNERSPVLLLMGGGMGAGKSTVLKDALKQSFWSGSAAADAVVVEADAFKETDVIYKALNSRGHSQDMLQTSELVHQSSTDAASSLLVTALNEGRDVIMDGTLSWVPYVEQTIAMARNVHKYRYSMGVGYKVSSDGTITENYWEKEDVTQEKEQGQQAKMRKPYRIELVGVVCDAYLAVVRGIRRAVIMGRAVRVKSQLKSHKQFASAFPGYCQLVDNARLYSTNALGGPPKLIGWKDGDNKLLIDPDEIKCLSIASSLNHDAEGIYDLYPQPAGQIYEAGSVWNDIVLMPTRGSRQLELKAAIQKIENQII